MNYEEINEKLKIISTHHLTVLIMSVILRIEQKINGYLNIDKYPFVRRKEYEHQQIYTEVH